VPFELVDAVLAETGTAQRRLRDLPSRVGVYFLLAMCLFPTLGYGLVWGKLVRGLQGMTLPTPRPKALRDLRRRLGPARLEALFGVLAGPLAQPGTPGCASPATGPCRLTAAARRRCPTPTVTGPGWARTPALAGRAWS
jgi:hypothetical protein